MIIKIFFNNIKFSKYIQQLCCRPYRGHSHGCPNYGKKKGCPPKTKLIDEIFNFDDDLYLIYTEFNIGEFAKRMWKLHPKWSEYQAYNCLYWQGRARKLHRQEIEKAIKKVDLTKVITAPEAHGINVTALMLKCAKIKLEWPPRKITRVVSLGVVTKDKSLSVHCEHTIAVVDGKPEILTKL